MKEYSQLHKLIQLRWKHNDIEFVDIASKSKKKFIIYSWCFNFFFALNVQEYRFNAKFILKFQINVKIKTLKSMFLISFKNALCLDKIFFFN